MESGDIIDAHLQQVRTRVAFKCQFVSSSFPDSLEDYGIDFRMPLCVAC